jgi:hypothetical protein
VSRTEVGTPGWAAGGAVDMGSIDFVVPFAQRTEPLRSG